MIGKFVNIEVDGEELQKIFKDLSDAEETIMRCYGRLKNLGVVKVKDPQTGEED